MDCWVDYHRRYLSVTKSKLKKITNPLSNFIPTFLTQTFSFKKIIVYFITRGKIRKSKAPYGPLLFFVKQKGKLCGVIYCRGLNSTTKKKNTSNLRIDRIFDRLASRVYFREWIWRQDIIIVPFFQRKKPLSKFEKKDWFIHCQCLNSERIVCWRQKNYVNNEEV